MDTTAIKSQSSSPVLLDRCTREEVIEYFQNTWELYELLFSAIKSEETYYKAPDPLRNPLIFYWGHTAAFYINKLVLAGMLSEGLDTRFDTLFAIGVDPGLPEDLDTIDRWPSVFEVTSYRAKVYEIVMQFLRSTDFDLPITSQSPWWAVMMGVEHDRIHFETSSVLIRQLPVELVERPEEWQYAASMGMPKTNDLIHVNGGVVTLGKQIADNVFGWDNEYGRLEKTVEPFEATRNLISNAEFLEFVKSGEYNNADHWSAKGLEWKERVGARKPKFWLFDGINYSYRAMFENMEMPFDWPVEVNAYEAEAYCRWTGAGWRLLSEAEYVLIGGGHDDPDFKPECRDDLNLNFKIGSPSPVGCNTTGQTPLGFNDLYGNVWDWLSDDFEPLPGFKVHPWYADFSEPFFDSDHAILLGGSWATTGAGATKFYRLWFRRHFYQHAGFRLARSLDTSA